MDGANRKRTHHIKTLYLAEEYLNGNYDIGHTEPVMGYMGGNFLDPCGE